MRATLMLIFAMVAAAFAAGYLALFSRTASEPEPTPAGMALLRREFSKSAAPELELGVQELFPAARAELLDPAENLPRSPRFPYEELRKLYRYATSCEPRARVGRPPVALAKPWEWHAWVCSPDPAEPPGPRFFALAPYIHPSGSSYAFMAWKSGRGPYPSLEWVRKNLAFFHLGELARLPAGALDPSRAALAELDRAGQQALRAGAPLVLGRDRVFLKSASGARGEDLSETRYAVYRLDAFERFVAGTAFSLRRAAPASGCAYREGNACWGFNVARVYRRAKLPSLVLFGSTALLAAVLALTLFRRMKEQREEEARKRFALQTLTHELRTPIASLRVSAEALRRHFDRLPGEGQEAFLRVCDDLQRLQRLTEASRQYLGSAEGGRWITLKPERHESLRAFLESVLDACPRGADLAMECADGPFEQDAYWLSICLKNLVENALAHGKPPVRLVASLEGRVLSLSISDAGQCPFSSLDEMTEPFAKGSSSAGLGLGLAIVRRIVKEMGGSLEFNSNPTRFRIRLS